LRFLKWQQENITSKIYSELLGRPLISHSLAVFNELPEVSEIVIAIPKGEAGQFKKLILSPLRIRKKVSLVTGGKTRTESVWNALVCVSKKSRFVCIHDAARPMIQPGWLMKLANKIGSADGIVLGAAMVPTIKELNAGTKLVRKTLDRSQLFEAQTPQLICKNKLMEAYRKLGQAAFQVTDDASLIEAIGGKIKTYIQPDPNLKVTTYQDLILIRKIMDGSCKLKFGFGCDLHRLAPNRKFYLGGIQIPSRVGPVGHSDGDPLLHAMTDGVLGAMGEGDIGDFFSDRDPRWKNMRSIKFLNEALRLARSKGYVPFQVDANIVLEKPKLGKKKREIGTYLAKILSLNKEQVNIKAKTAEGLGPEGAGEAVSCHALIVMKSVGGLK